MTWVLDLDGVVWLSEQAIEGSAQAVARLRSAGETVLFLTNNSDPTFGSYFEKLARVGIPAGEDALLTSAWRRRACSRPAVWPW